MGTIHARILGIWGVIATTTGSLACIVDEIPACPGQCFAYTILYDGLKACQNDQGTGYFIAFTGTDPDGYRGRACFNSSSIPLVVQAIDHLEAGGQLSDLGMDVVTAYVSTVDAVQADLEAECILAAAGQCTNAQQVCTGIAADAYEQLVVDQSCVLELDGTEPVALGPDQACEAFTVDPDTGSEGSGEHCLETTTATTAGLDDTSGSDGADETSGATTGMVMSTNLRPR